MRAERIYRLVIQPSTIPCSRCMRHAEFELQRYGGGKKRFVRYYCLGCLTDTGRQPPKASSPEAGI